MNLERQDDKVEKQDDKQKFVCI